MTKKRDSDFKLMTYDDIFSTQEQRDEEKLEKIREINIEELHPFKDHPFKVLENEDLDKIIESVDKFGVLTPALARPLEGGGYELISGHRRLKACERLGLETMPVIVRDMTDDEAVIAMVDANLQREKILPSEKAFAYRMKLEALNHQGKTTSCQVGKKSWSGVIASKDSGDSERQIHRYIRLTYLHPEILLKVDDEKIAFSPAVEISYLTLDEQTILLDAMEQNDCTPSHAQSIRLKNLSRLGELTDEKIYEILSEEKPNQQEVIKLKKTSIEKYFPKSYTLEQMERDVYKGLELLKKQRDRKRDAR